MWALAELLSNFALQAGDSLAKVSTIADETVLSMDEISAGAMEVSNDTGVAFADFNEALYQTISATGDTANAALWIAILVLSAAGITGVRIWNKKKQVKRLGIEEKKEEEE